MSRSFALATLLALAPTAPAQVKKILNDFPFGVECVAFSPDGKTLATGTLSRGGGKDALRLWDIATGKELCCLRTDKFGCSALAFSPDGRTLVSNGGLDSTIDVWDLATRKVRMVIKTGLGVGRCLAVSPDGKLLAAGSFSRPTMLFDMETGKERATLEGTLKVTCVVFSPDGKTLATSAFGGAVALWDVPSGKLRGALARHKRTVYNASFAPDGRTLYSLGEDQLLVHWDVATGKERRSVDLRKQAGYSTRYSALSPDGKTLAVLGGGRLRLLDLEEGAFRPDVDWQHQVGGQRCIAFSPDGKLIATGSGGNVRNCSVYLWDVPPPKKKSRD